MKNLVISVLGAIATVQMDIWVVRPKGMFVCILFIWLMITYAVDFKWQEVQEWKESGKRWR